MPRWLLALLALPLATCGSRGGRPEVDPERVWDVGASAGLDGRPLHRSGLRLKIVWASAEGVRFPIEIYDRARNLPCTLRGNVCLPEGRSVDRLEDLAYFDEDRQLPAAVVDAGECESPSSSSDELWALGAHDWRWIHRSRASSPRWVSGVWLLAGGGCVPYWERSSRRVCLRPMTDEPLDDLVVVREAVLAPTAGASGALVAEATDGAILPRWGYFDAEHDRMCSLDDAHCRTRALAPEPTFPQRLVGPGRIALRVRVTPDGREVPISLFDRDLQRDCVATAMDDGRWRCTVRVEHGCDHEEAYGGRPEMLTPSTSFCHDPATCCRGGPIWIPARPAHLATCVGIGGCEPAEPARAGRALRFATQAREEAASWIYTDARRIPVLDVVERLDERVFAELRIERDP